MKHFLRGTQKPIPDQLHLYLTELQQLGLCQAEQYGWHLEFIRRPPFHDTEAIIMDTLQGKEIGILRHDGTVDTQPDIHLRH
jgi:hypothetical protein